MSVSLSRRNFLRGAVVCGSGLPIGCSLSPGSTSSDYEVVVVGAGAAGLAALRTLREAGKSAVLVEASDRIGGRAYTDTATLGVPVDLGAHWLHYGFENPFNEYASGLGGPFSLVEQSEEVVIYQGQSKLCDGTCGGYDDQVAAAQDAMWEARYNDVAAVSVVDPGNQWGRTAEFSIGPWEMAKALRQVSTSDWSCSAEGENYVCRAGYGALLTRSASDLPVQLSTTVTEIIQTKDGVEVVTDNGTLRAQACIVTVSNGVLAAERIGFTPALSEEKRRAIAEIPMGHYARVALRFDRDIFGAGPSRFVLDRIEAGAPVPAETFGVTSNVLGTGVCYCDTGGAFAEALQAAGTGAAVQAALDHLRGMLGAKTVDDAYSGLSAASDWSNNPLTYGAYASANPGSFEQRAVLRAPTEDRIFLAGEACDLDQWATVGGAHTNGCETALNVLRYLSGDPLLGYGSCSAIFDEEEVEESAETAAACAVGM